jgi:hypothetical protein
LQSSSAACVLTFVIPVPESVKGTTLTTARDAHRHAAAVLKNVEGWLAEFNEPSIVLFLQEH